MLHALFRSRFTLGSLPPYFWVRLIEIDNILYNRVMALDSYQNFVSIYPTLRYWNANNCSQFSYLWGHLPCSAELRTLFIITRACAGPFLVYLYFCGWYAAAFREMALSYFDCWQDESWFTWSKFGWDLGHFSVPHSSFFSPFLFGRRTYITEILLTGLYALTQSNV